MSRRTVWAFFGMVICTGIAARALPVRAEERPCAEYVKKFCPSERPGTPKAMTCLSSHLSELSEACKKRVESATATRKTGQDWTPRQRASCKNDLVKFCKDVKPGAGRLLACIQSHKADVSAECRATLPK